MDTHSSCRWENAASLAPSCAIPLFHPHCLLVLVYAMCQEYSRCMISGKSAAKLSPHIQVLLESERLKPNLNPEKTLYIALNFMMDCLQDLNSYSLHLVDGESGICFKTQNHQRLSSRHKQDLWRLPENLSAKHFTSKAWMCSNWTHLKMFLVVLWMSHRTAIIRSDSFFKTEKCYLMVWILMIKFMRANRVI